MTEPCLLATLRTPRGKASRSGGLAGVAPLRLLELLMNGVVTRTGLDPALLDDVIIGCAGQTGEQGANLARTAVLDLGWPDTVPGMTLNRFCTSGLDAIATAAAMVRSGQAQLVLAGGVESVSRVPMFTDNGPLWTDEAVIGRIGSVHMGIAADVVATERGYRRDELDAYGLRTQRLAADAWRCGRHGDSLLAVHDEDGTLLLDHDEHVRAEVDAAAYAAMRPAFAELGAAGQDDLVARHLPELGPVRHLHTRGTSPSLADAAGLALVGTEQAARRCGITPRARLLGATSAGGEPVRMLLAGQRAAELLLARLGIDSESLDVVEFAEAFAALCLAVQQDLRLGDEVFNPNGGTIAMGHAFGATGVILAAGCADELHRRGGRYGLVVVSGAAGSGTALLLERAA